MLIHHQLFVASFSFLQIWSSDLKRSWQTANFLVKNELINEECSDKNSLLMDKPLPIIQADVRIRERVSYTSIFKALGLFYNLKGRTMVFVKAKAVQFLRKWLRKLE